MENDLKEIIDMLKKNKCVTDINLKRGSVSKVGDNGWIERQESDETFISFTYDKNSTISLEDKYIKKRSEKVMYNLYKNLHEDFSKKGMGL